MKLTTTLNRIHECSPCSEGWRKLLQHAGAGFNPDQEIDLLTILESNGVQDTLWCLRATVQDSRGIAILMAADFAESVLPLFEKAYPEDKRPREAIQAARDFVAGKIAIDAAYAAAYAAYAAYAAAAYAAAAYAARAAEIEKQKEIIRKYLAS